MTHPLVSAAHLAFWTDLRNHFAAKCSAAQISGVYPPQYRLWKAELRRADKRLRVLRVLADI